MDTGAAFRLESVKLALEMQIANGKVDDSVFDAKYLLIEADRINNYVLSGNIKN